MELVLLPAQGSNNFGCEGTTNFRPAAVHEFWSGLRHRALGLKLTTGHALSLGILGIPPFGLGLWPKGHGVRLEVRRV